MKKGEVIGFGRLQEAQQKRDESAISLLDVDSGVRFILTSKEIKPADPELNLHPRFASILPRVKRVRSRRTPEIPQA